MGIGCLGLIRSLPIRLAPNKVGVCEMIETTGAKDLTEIGFQGVHKNPLLIGLFLMKRRKLLHQIKQPYAII